MFRWNEPSAMYQIVIYPIASHLWRWEIRSSAGALLRCGTARTEAAAEGEVLEALEA
jgi:hypothetical protein